MTTKEEKINNTTREIISIINKKSNSESEVEDILKVLVGYFHLQKFVYGTKKPKAKPKKKIIKPKEEKENAE